MRIWRKRNLQKRPLFSDWCINDVGSVTDHGQKLPLEVVLQKFLKYYGLIVILVFGAV